MQYAACHHLKEDGIYCGSPALSGRNYCYYHLNLRGRRFRRAQARRRGERYRLHLPTLDNLRAVQVAIMEVLDAMAEGQLDSKSAGIMLYGIQQATVVLRAVEEQAEWIDEDEEEAAGRVREFPGFEQKFGIPPGLDLEAEPEVALQQAEEQPGAPFKPDVGLSVDFDSPASAPVATITPRFATRRPGEHEQTYEDLRQQLEYLQQPQSDALDESKKPAASASPREEEEEAMTSTA